MKTSGTTTKKQLRTRTAKQSPQPKLAVSRNGLIPRQVDNRRSFAFPQMKGRILDRVEFYTAPDHHHSLSLYFQDKTTLTLVIEPCFLLAAGLFDSSSGEQRLLKRWRVIRSATEKA